MRTTRPVAMSRSSRSRSDVEGDFETLVASIADWSEWCPFREGAPTAPRRPGVYIFRVGDTVRYVGVAKERDSNGTKAPLGIYGRLQKYVSGAAANSGFGRHVLDQALADPGFLQERVEHLRSQGPETVVEWTTLAFDRLDPHVCWAVTESGAEARVLEGEVIHRLQSTLWNRRRGVSKALA